MMACTGSAGLADIATGMPLSGSHGASEAVLSAAAAAYAGCWLSLGRSVAAHTRHEARARSFLSAAGEAADYDGTADSERIQVDSVQVRARTMSETASEPGPLVS